MTEAVAHNPETTDLLSTTERAELQTLESRISVHMAGFIEVGESLGEIRDKRLYRESHATFDAYLQDKWSMTRQHANRLVAAAHTASVLEPIGFRPENERQAREQKKSAAIYEKAAPAVQQAFARLAQKTTGTMAPSNLQMDALGELLVQIDAHGVVDDPETGEQVSVESLAPERLDAVLRANLSTTAYETTKRQEIHIQDSVLNAKSNGRGGWTDWFVDKSRDLPEGQEVQIVGRPDGKGGTAVFVRIVQSTTVPALACGETAGWPKAAVLDFIREHGK